MTRAWSVLLVCCAACATPSDYTPQIAVVPGAAARSLWIASKRPPAEEDAAEPEPEVDGPGEPSDAGDDAPSR